MILRVDLFFADVYRRARKKAEELKTFGVTVHFYLIKELSDQFIAPLLQEAEDDELDGIALVPLNMDSIRQFVQKMNKRNIPMVFFNLDMEDARRLSYVGAITMIPEKLRPAWSQPCDPRKGEDRSGNQF